MPVTENIPLEEQLKQLGFKRAIKDVRMYIRAKSFKFSIPQSREIGNDSLLYRLEFDNSDDDTKLKRYGLTLQSVIIPKGVVEGVNLDKLEKNLIKADKIYNNYYFKDIPASKEENELIKGTNDKIHQLFNAGGTAKEIASLLMFKYWTQHNYQKYISNVTKIKENYVSEITVEWNNGQILSADEAYAKAKESFYVPKIKEMSEKHVVSDALFEAAQFEISFGREWVTLNSVPYFLDTGDVYFFKTRDEALEFSTNNISEFDNYNVLHTSSIRDFLLQVPYGRVEGNRLINLSSKNSVMNTDNLKYLTDNLKYMGFGEKLNDELQQKMQEGKTDFQITASVEFNKKSFEATLNFRKSDSTDMYFFNNYHASLEKSNGEKVDHTFYLNKGKGVTAKEAFNLLDGRAVHKDLITKDGNEYKAWLQLDFENKTDKGFEVKQFHENYGYDLKDAVSKFAVAELKEPEKEKALMASLQKGNVQSITIEKNGESHKMFVEANPQFKNVTLYDSSMKMVAKESLSQYQAGVEKGAKAVKEDMADDKKKELTKGQKPDEKKNGKSLLPKKREGKAKGLGIS